MGNLWNLAVMVALTIGVLAVLGGLFLLVRTIVRAEKNKLSVPAEAAKERTDLLARLSALEINTKVALDKTAADVKAAVAKGSSDVVTALAAHQKQINELATAAGIVSTVACVAKGL